MGPSCDNSFNGDEAPVDLSTKSRKKLRLEEFLRQNLDDAPAGNVIEWVDRSRGLFRILWTHQSSGAFTHEHAKLFRYWAVARGKSPDQSPVELKQSLRMALNKSPSVTRIHTSHHNAEYRYFCFTNPKIKCRRRNSKFDLNPDQCSSLTDEDKHVTVEMSSITRQQLSPAVQTTPTNYCSELLDHQSYACCQRGSLTTWCPPYFQNESLSDCNYILQRDLFYSHTRDNNPLPQPVTNFTEDLPSRNVWNSDFGDKHFHAFCAEDECFNTNTSFPEFDYSSNRLFHLQYK